MRFPLIFFSTYIIFIKRFTFLKRIQWSQCFWGKGCLGGDSFGQRSSWHSSSVSQCCSADLYLLNQRTAIYHQEGQLRIFYLVRSVPGPNSAFLWKTAVILIDEIQRCPKQSGRSPTVAHRRGAAVLSLFGRKKGARPENTRGTKITSFLFKWPRKQRLFTASGKVKEPLSVCRPQQY